MRRADRAAAASGGTLAAGRCGRIGHGSGTHCDYAERGNNHAAPLPTVSIGQANPTPGDALDKAIIRRYIKRNLQKIVYCYEKQLVAKPALAGTVTAKFEISGNGHVTSSSASGLDPNVESCIAQAIRTIEFPKPIDNKTVDVVYPFTFRPAT
jgi:hypothetical protein